MVRKSSRAAALLAKAWRTGARLDALPKNLRPRSAAAAYRIQDAFARALGEPALGWKIGCTSAAARRILKTRAPMYGRVLASRLFASGVELGGTHYKLRGVEGEFAFKLKRDLPPRRRPYARPEVLAAIGGLHPAIEVIEPRYADWLAVGIHSVIADLGGNGTIVLGTAVPAWRRIDLREASVRMTLNGKIVGEGTGADCMGDPVAALVWLANALRNRGGLRAGEIVSTGTCCGFHRAAAGDRCIADFGRLGRVLVRFAGA